MNVEEIVMKEIEEAKQEHGDLWWSRYFNNLLFKLPFGLYRRAYPELQELEIDEKGTSDLLKGKTYAQFHEEVDKAAREVGLDFDKLKELQDAYHGIRSSKEKSTLRMKILELGIPVYIRLREKGYKHYPDLTI